MCQCRIVSDIPRIVSDIPSIRSASANKVDTGNYFRKMKVIEYNYTCSVDPVFEPTPTSNMLSIWSVSAT